MSRGGILSNDLAERLSSELATLRQRLFYLERSKTVSESIEEMMIARPTADIAAAAITSTEITPTDGNAKLFWYDRTNQKLVLRNEIVLSNHTAEILQQDVNYEVHREHFSGRIMPIIGKGTGGGPGGEFDCSELNGWNPAVPQVLIHLPGESCKWSEIDSGC